MIRLVIIFFFALPIFAQAQSVPTEAFQREFATDSSLQRAAKAYQVCAALFSSWPSPSYSQTILQIGNSWKANPDSAYYLINTCNTMWISRYLDPAKGLAVKQAQDHSRFAHLLSSLDLINAAKYFPEEVRIYSDLHLPANSQVPQSPYEVLGQFASSERQLDEALSFERRQAFTALAVTGGNLAVLLRSIKTVAGVVETRSQMVARTAKQMTLVTLLAYAAGELVDAGLWQMRESDLWVPVAELTKNLSQTQGQAPLPILLDEFYRATERLGYFYSYNLYLAETSAGHSHATVNDKCYSELKQIFNGATLAKSLSRAFADQSICADAATLWLGASQFLSEHYPNDPQALQVADRLMSRAKRTYISYEETKAYEKTLPVCRPTFSATNGGTFSEECFDPISGKWMQYAATENWSNYGKLAKKGNCERSRGMSSPIKRSFTSFRSGSRFATIYG